MEPSGVTVSAARAGALHCATSGNAAAEIPARVLCHGKASLLLFGPLEARRGFSHSSSTPGLRSVAPGKDQIRPLSHSPGCGERCKPGWNRAVEPLGPLFLWGSGVYYRLALLVDQCLTGSSAECHGVPFCSSFWRQVHPCFPFSIHSAFPAERISLLPGLGSR